MDKQVRALYGEFIISLFIMAWGSLCLFFYSGGPVWKGELLTLLIGSSFIIAGTIFFSFAFRGILRYRKTGKMETRIDERAELNALRASRRGFQFFLVSMGILFLLWGCKVINDTIFVALTGPVFAIGSVVYVISYYVYERSG
jgi:hypothetical protein